MAKKAIVSSNEFRKDLNKIYVCREYLRKKQEFIEQKQTKNK